MAREACPHIYFQVASSWVVFGLPRSIWRVMGSQISLSTAELTRPFTSTQLSTIHSGARKFRAWTSLGGHSGRTSQLSLLEEIIHIGDRLRLRSLSSPNLACLASSSESALAARRW